MLSDGGGNDDVEEVSTGRASAGSELMPSAVLALAAMGVVDLGPMCRNDFKVSAGATIVCEVIANFAAPSFVRELLVKASLKDMFASIKTNAVKVSFPYYACSLLPIRLFVCMTFCFARRL